MFVLRVRPIPCEYELDIAALAKFSKFLPVNVVALSVVIVFGMPLSFMYCSKSLTAVLPSFVSQKVATGRLL